MSTSESNQLLGVVLLTRHGDREGFYQDPTTYTPYNTALTPLGNQQEFQLGQLLRARYLNASSPFFIPGMNTTLANETEILIRADAGGEPGVIFNSAVALLQGLFPPTGDYNTTLANGSTVTGPLGGYQTVPIKSVDSNNDVSLEGWVSCNSFVTATNVFYNSSAFAQKAAEHADFISSLPKYLDGRPATLQNMWNIFDFMNVESIHDSNFVKALPPTYLAQARDLANWHEYNIFSSPQLNGVGNIAGRTILPSILNGFASIANPSDPLKFFYQAISYKPFISLFNMTGIAEMNPELAGIVNYAAAVALEVRQSPGAPPVLRLNFKNGTDDDDFKTYNFLNSSGDVPLSVFVNHVASSTVNDTATWCGVCQNAQDRGCAALAVATAKGAASVHLHQEISPLGAGFLGAGVTLAVVVMMVGVLFFLGMLSIGRARGRKRAGSLSNQSSDSKA